MLDEQEIRELNSEFNHKHYGQFMETEEASSPQQMDREGEGADLGATAALNKDTKSFYDSLAKDNLLLKMWQKVEFDEAAFKDHYEDWLEEEVWTYYD